MDTPPFNVKQGMFWGDNLSPVIFLTVFNSLVELSKHLLTCGFSLKVPVPNSTGFALVNSAIYVYWDESLSEEPTGWYYTIVKAHLLDGASTIEYAHVDKVTETVDHAGPITRDEAPTVSLLFETAPSISSSTLNSHCRRVYE